MKPSQRYATLLASAALVLTGTAQAQSNRATSDKMDSHGTTISRVTKDSVKDRFTAKDLIGAAVYDSTGEKIGDISDIDLQGTVPGQLATTFNSDQMADRTSSRPQPAAGAADATPSPSRPSAISGMDSALARATVFVSVGGLWGIGDDLVSVPVSQLNYDSAENRFELAVAKADVVALAEGERRDGYAAGASPSRTSAGKQSFADEATRVQKALASDPQTSAFASKITVTADGESLEIRGIVDNKEQQERIIEAARRATSLDVNDEIDVR